MKKRKERKYFEFYNYDYNHEFITFYYISSRHEIKANNVLTGEAAASSAPITAVVVVVLWLRQVDSDCV